MQVVKRLLLPALLLAAVSLACNMTSNQKLRATETAVAAEIYQAFTANAPMSTAVSEGVYAPQGTPIPLYTPTPLPRAVVEAPALNLRDGPDVEFQVLMALNQGEELTVMGQYGRCEWLKVERVTGDVGWVKGGPGFANFTGDCLSLAHGSYRPLNGTLVFDARSEFGSGSLTVDNGTPTDGLVVLVSPEGYPVVAFYLRNMEQHTLYGLTDGVYYIFYQNGQGWDGVEKRFMLVESIKRMDRPIEFVTTDEGYTTWTLALANSGSSTATASDIEEGLFPDLR